MPYLNRKLCFLFLAAWLPGYAEDARLAELQTALLPMRDHPQDHIETRGATAELTGVKHLLTTQSMPLSPLGHSSFLPAVLCLRWLEKREA